MFARCRISPHSNPTSLAQCFQCWRGRNYRSKGFTNLAKFPQTLRGKPGLNPTFGASKAFRPPTAHFWLWPQSYSHMWEKVLACLLLDSYIANMHSASRWAVGIGGCQIGLPWCSSNISTLWVSELDHHCFTLPTETQLSYNLDRCNSKIADLYQLSLSSSAGTQHLEVQVCDVH